MINEDEMRRDLHLLLFKVNGYIFRGDNSFSFLHPCQMGQTLEGKNLLLLRVHPLVEVLLAPGKQTGSHKSCSPSYKW